MPVAWSDITAFLKEGAAETRSTPPLLQSVAAISQAGEGQLTFVKAGVKNPHEMAQATHASAVIVDASLPLTLADFPPQVMAILRIENARLAFIRTVQQFFTPAEPEGIHPTAIVPSNAVIGKHVTIGAYCVLEGDIVLGDHVRILPYTMLRGKVHIGDHSYIGSHCAIGIEGYGFERTASGTLEKFPHIGGVIIESHVFVGSNTCIARGTLADTRIKRGAKIDNLVHVAHNCVIGEDAVVIANAMLGGSAVIGDRAWIAPSATLLDNITIGSDATVGIATLALKNVEDGAVVVGVPAKRIR